MHQALHLLFEALGFVVGYRYYRWSRERRGDTIDDAGRLWIIIGAAAGALIGSRVLGALEDPALLHMDLRAWWTALNNRTIVGGLLGGLIGVELTKRIIGVHQRSGDLFVLPLVLGMSIGRIGCLFAGMDDNTYGVASGLPWAMDLGDGVRRHPTNVYELLFLAALGGLLTWVRTRWTLVPGALFKVFMCGYLAFRLLVDAVKPAPAVALGLGSIQIACLMGLLYYYRVWTAPDHLIAHDHG